MLSYHFAHVYRALDEDAPFDNHTDTCDHNSDIEKNMVEQVRKLTIKT